ncbi:hypothetical protein A2903_00945 [Candidatus Nomurabacteria bacterium RIFCSPLOWO2_01_FULL_33_17]|uniref:RDD domain-containing protein n=1 Tax=Candidatus Nomurabacteria bacterium RIFCSPLOWO2_01_FULL_33_17 TaxID=1801764 RepID=A0A1F6WPT0_9BACT|nr:MAG: hypothetical protein A2903_00945 [Candidatus Nomurabacteria bacterium RIFCSPLOWO2_01_FULL_33_17]
MFCQKCGNQLIEGSVFCSSCGQGIASPVSPVDTAKPALLPASLGKRVGNYFLDIIGFYLFFFLICFIVGFFSGFISSILKIEDLVNFDSLDSLIFSLFSFIALIFYYLFFEYIWQRTPGKWITGTKVVRFNGDKPKFMQIVGRTFARFIPFEFLSFLSNNPVGWHDHLSKTFVVPAKYTKEDILILNSIESKKKYNNIGIIVIVVIFSTILLIGIFAALVLTSLNSAREKAKQAQQSEQIL